MTTSYGEDLVLTGKSLILMCTAAPATFSACSWAPVGLGMALLLCCPFARVGKQRQYGLEVYTLTP